MSQTVGEEQASGRQLLQQSKRQVVLDGLWNTVVNSTTAYIILIDVVLVGIGFGIDATTGPPGEATNAPLVLAGVFGVFAIILGSVYLLSLVGRGLLVVYRAYTSDF